MDLNFNLETYVPQESGFEDLPNGVYNVVLDSAEDKVSQAGNEYVNFTYCVVDGKYEGRKVFQSIHPNSEKAKVISDRVLAEMCNAFGFKRIESTGQLVDRFCRIRVQTKVRDGQKRTEVVSVLPKEEAPATW